jgi:hypothetical protein
VYVAPTAQIIINGTGFGSAPPVVIYSDWSGLVEGTTLDNSAAIVGPWTTGNYGSGLYSKVIEAHGFTGAGLREGGTNAATDNRLTGFVKTFSPKRNFFVAYEEAVPTGRHFPGATATNTLPNISTLKPVWLSDDALDEFAKFDVVIGSWTSANFGFLGNSTPYNLNMGASFDFNGYNGVMASSVAGADPYADNANLFALYCNANTATTVTTKTDAPAYYYTEGYKPQIQTTGTLFRVTINGTNCDYVQQAGDTTNTNIATGLKAAIDAAAISGITTSQFGSQVLAAPPLRSTFTSTVSANITRIQMLPQVTHINGPAWSGSSPQDLAQLVYKYMYVAVADDSSVNKRVELLDNANYLLSTMHRCIFPTTGEDYWTDTSIAITPSATLRSGATHVCVTLANGSQTITAIEV